VLLDVFLWNGELDMAELRVRTLRDHVDGMVAVSCNLTHQSEPAPRIPPPDGCEWLIVDAKPIPEGRGGVGSDWYQWIERQHRDGCIEAAAEYGPETVVMVSDVDEIPDPSTLDEIHHAAFAGPVAVPMRMHGFALNYLYPSQWVGTTASTAALLAPQAHRSWRYRCPQAGKGWHLSWFGDLEEKRRKLRSFSHAELHALDVEDCYQRGIHANGERMTAVPRAEVERLDWPPPLFQGFDIPPSWWAPED
jgi:hypothetical protein